MFKEALVNLVIEHKASDELVKYIGEKITYANHEKCYSYRVVNKKVVSEVESELECLCYEEADTKIVLYTYHAKLHNLLVF